MNRTDWAQALEQVYQYKHQIFVDMMSICNSRRFVELTNSESMGKKELQHLEN